MDDTKREELEKACKKIHKVRARMAAVRMVRVLDMSVDEITHIQVRCPRGPPFAALAVPTFSEAHGQGFFHHHVDDEHPGRTNDHAGGIVGDLVYRRLG